MEIAHDIVQSPITALVVCLLFGAFALSGRLSIAGANICLIGVFIVGTSQIVRSAQGHGKLILGGSLMLAGACFILSYWLKPPTPKVKDSSPANVQRDSTAVATQPLAPTADGTAHLQTNHSVKKPPPATVIAEKPISTEQKNAEIRDKLSRLLGEYTTVTKICTPNAIGPARSGASFTEEECAKKFNDWSWHVDNYISANLENADWIRFRRFSQYEYAKKADFVEKLIEEYKK